jgi:prepilin-type N-terminal cleavage/methylation domain-containing protein
MRVPQRGFSLIELLISTAIIVAVAAIVIVRFSTFDSTTLLKSLAYEVAATIREAQVHSVSVLGADPNFRYPYGVTFAPGAESYTAFQYMSSDINDRPEYNILPSAPVLVDEVGTYTIGRSMHIVETCVMISSVSNCNVGRLDISFRRPEFKAIFHAVPSSGSITDTNIESAQIKLQSKNGGDKWVVSVGLLGNVSVYREP